MLRGGVLQSRPEGEGKFFDLVVTEPDILYGICFFEDLGVFKNREIAV